MYPFVRLLSTLYRAARAEKIEPTAASTTTFYCMPWDIDLFLEMNNGRILTLYDLGRFDLSIRTGLSEILRKNNWGLVVAGGSVRYRKRIRAFSKVTMRTQMVAVEDRWVYIAQSMWLGDVPASSILLRTAITAKGKALHTDELKRAFAVEDIALEPEGWVKAWVEAEDERPWPPLP